MTAYPCPVHNPPPPPPQPPCTCPPIPAGHTWTDPVGRTYVKLLRPDGQARWYYVTVSDNGSVRFVDVYPNSLDDEYRRDTDKR